MYKNLRELAIKLMSNYVMDIFSLLSSWIILLFFHVFPAGYAKEFVGTGVQGFPHSLQPTTHGTHTGRPHLSGENFGPSIKQPTQGIKVEKSKILLLGPTGCGRLKGRDNFL